MNATRDNSGAIFNNQRRERDNQPDRTGKATIGGIEYYVDAWTKQGPKGPYISLAFKPKAPSPARD